MIGVNLSEELQRIRKIMNLDEQVKHIFQPTGHSCGPTCIKMVGDFIKGDVGKIEDICQSCGTDFVVGTPPDKMKKGLNSLGIKYVEHISEKEPFQSIKNTIDKGNVAIVRTITRDVPHWIVIVAYDGDVFDVHDPWLGQIKYNEKKLGNIWKVRDFFYFEILASQPKTANDITIRKMTDTMSFAVFGFLTGKDFKIKEIPDFPNISDFFSLYLICTQRGHGKHITVVTANLAIQ